MAQGFQSHRGDLWGDKAHQSPLQAPPISLHGSCPSAVTVAVTACHLQGGLQSPRSPLFHNKHHLLLEATLFSSALPPTYCGNFTSWLSVLGSCGDAHCLPAYDLYHMVYSHCPRLEADSSAQWLSYYRQWRWKELCIVCGFWLNIIQSTVLYKQHHWNNNKVGIWTEC